MFLRLRSRRGPSRILRMAGRLAAGLAFAVWASLAGPRPAASAQLDSLLAQAESALASGDLKAAARTAHAARRMAPRDPSTLLVSGRVEFARPWARFRALRYFRRAAALDPSDLEPWYWTARVGVALKGGDGEGIARPALERVLGADPFYRDAWDLWLSLYRKDAERAALVRALEPHARDPEVASRIAFLRMESGDLSAADSLLADLLARVGPEPRWLVWRAEVAFLEWRDSAGRMLYERAVDLSSWDSTDELWQAVAGIAQPGERSTYRWVRPSARPEFYRRFWAYRDPNLLTPENERIPEHFRRRAEARQRFGLRHPLSLIHYSRAYRDLVSYVSQKERGRAAATAVALGAARAEAIARALGLEPSPDRIAPLDVDVGAMAEPEHGASGLRALSPEVLPLGVNLLDRVDDRGLVWVRHGKPDRRVSRLGGEEWWSYDRPPRLVVRFDLPAPEEAPVGDILFRPINRSMVSAVALAMTTDRSDVPAPLEFGFWFARFRGRSDTRGLETYLFVDSEHAAAALFDGSGRALARGEAGAAEPLVLASPPGEFLLAVDAEEGGELGRHRSRITLPRFESDSLTLSDLLFADGVTLESAPDRAPQTRELLAARALPGLRAPVDQPFWVYAEVYGAATGADGSARYEVAYQFRRLRSWLGRLLKGDDRIELRFVRHQRPRADGALEERLLVKPRELQPGAYEVRIRVRDLVSGAVSERRSLRLELI